MYCIYQHIVGDRIEYDAGCVHSLRPTAVFAEFAVNRVFARVNQCADVGSVWRSQQYHGSTANLQLVKVAADLVFAVLRLFSLFGIHFRSPPAL